MNNIDKIIAPLFPGWAASRLRARHMVSAYARAYEAAKPGRLHKKRTDRGNGDSAVLEAGDSLRMQARHLDENHDLAKGVLNTLVNNIIGVGIRVEPQVKDRQGNYIAEFGNKLLELFRDWSMLPEVTGELHWHAVQRMACRSWLRDGEMIAQLLEGDIAGLDHGTRVPFSVELIEADLLPFELNDEKRGIVQGVEKNKWGRPRAYHILKEHPGDPNNYSFYLDTKRVKAENIVHLKLSDRIRQTRGVSVFASVLHRLDDIKDYEESERVAARVAAAMCAFFRKSIDGAPVTTTQDGASQSRTMKMAPGMIFDNLLPGEDIVSIESKRPNAGLEPFRNGQLRAVAAGTYTGYSSISKNYNGTYSAQRQELVEQYVHYAVLREHFIERFVRPVWVRFVRMALLSKAIEKPAGVNEDTFFDADFRGPSVPWIDPLKEINAEEKAVQAGFKSRSQVIRERGANPQDVNDQIKRERDDESSKGLVFTSNPSHDKKPISEKPDKEEEPDEGNTEDTGE